MFLRLVLDTGLRMKEAYTLRVSQIDFARGFINVEGSKGHRGSAKPRTVPLKPGIAAELRAWCTDRVGLVFGYWDGDKDTMKRTTNQLTSRFRSLFRHVELPDMKEHDLRHEACCRWFELRGKDGHKAIRRTCAPCPHPATGGIASAFADRVGRAARVAPVPCLLR